MDMVADPSRFHDNEIRVLKGDRTFYVCNHGLGLRPGSSFWSIQRGTKSVPGDKRPDLPSLFRPNSY